MLWRYEVGNVLGLTKPTLAVELMNALLAYEFDEVLLRTEYRLAVLEHMREVKHVTFYRYLFCSSWLTNRYLDVC